MATTTTTRARGMRGLALGVALLMASGGAAQAEWRRAETANFLVYGQGSERDLRPHAERLERFDALLRRQLGVSPVEGARKLPVYLVFTGKELRQVHPGMDERTAGFYSASEVDVYSVLNRRSGNHVLFHEYAHHFMFQNFPGRYPAWFVEGFAEFFMTASVDDPARITLGYFHPGRLHALNEGAWLPMERLLTARPRETEGRPERAAFYAQSWLLTHYMLSDAERRRGLDAYLLAVAGGTPPLEALQIHMGHTPESLEQALRAYLRGRMTYAQFSMADVPEPSMTVQVLPESADRMLLDSLNIRYPKSEADGAALLAKVREDAARYPGDRLALTALGQAEMNWGVAVAAEAALEQVLAAAPSDPEALQLMARLRIRAGEAQGVDAADRSARYREAQAYLARALEAAPTDYRIYAALARLRREASGYPNENDLQTWRLAVAYAPQVMGLRVQAAEAMARGGRIEEAIQLLTPAADNPHGGEDAARARERLDALKRQTAPAN